MSYEVYRLTKVIESDLEDDFDFRNERIFTNCVSCFNIIADVKKYNPDAPYFDLKVNWALLKKQCFNAVLVNIQKWLEQANPKGYED